MSFQSVWKVIIIMITDTTSLLDGYRFTLEEVGFKKFFCGNRCSLANFFSFTAKSLYLPANLLHVPAVSMATGMNACVAVRLEYFIILFIALFVATPC